MKKMLKLFFPIVLVCLLVACGNLTPVSTVTKPTVIRPLSPTPSPIPVDTLFPTNIPTSTLDFCNLTQQQGEIRVMSGLLFTSFEPGGPVDFDRILGEQDLAWTNFQQSDHGEMRSAGVIFHETALGPEWGVGVNPAVILVTYGVEQNWELPANGDLVSEVEQIRAVLFQYSLEWIHGQVDQNQYPPMANAATYALYRYFNGDLSMLYDWCSTYVRVYGESPLK